MAQLEVFRPLVVPGCRTYCGPKSIRHWATSSTAGPVCDEAQWAALARLVGGEALAADPRLGTPAGRKAHEDELEATVAAWARGLAAQEAERSCRLRASPRMSSPPRRTSAATRRSPPSAAFVAQPEPRGRVEIVEASRLRLSSTPAQLDRSAPPIGRDTAAILRDFAGYHEAKINALVATGALR